tara:strand:- start:182 stop:874 length:693 start_codon:yes stop_codon:yes gene_type:complete
MQNFIIIGNTRTGTHRIAEFLYKNLKYKIKTEKRNKNIYSGLLREDLFKKEKNKFYIFKPELDKKFTSIEIKKLLKKKILITHKIYRNIFFDFKDYKYILSIRDPISVINSTIMYVTKKNIMKFNNQYKIKNPLKLVQNKKIIDKYIRAYYNFYKSVYNKVNGSNLKKLIIVDYEENLNKKFKSFEFKDRLRTVSKFHSTKKNKKVEKFLNENYNFSDCFKIYNYFLKKI